MAQQDEADAFTDDDLSAVGEDEVTDEDFSQAAPPPAPPVWVRDRKTGRLARARKDQADTWSARGEADIVPDDVAQAEYARAMAQSSPPKPRPQAADPGFFTTVGRNLLSGFFKQGSDEAAGTLAGAFTNVGPGARYKQPDGTTRPLNDRGDVYRAVRDTEREVLRGGTEHYPWTSFGASVAGDIASDAALGALGVPVTSTPYQVASGALSGFLGSDAELTGKDATLGNAASAAGSTALGAGLGYALPKVGAAVSRHLTPALASRMRQWLEDSAINQGRRVLLNGADALRGNKELPSEAVREALESKAIPAFGTTQQAYAKLEDLAEQRGANYGDILKRLQASGVEGPNVSSLADYFDSVAERRWRNSGSNKSVADLFADEAANLRAVAPPARNSFAIVGEGPMAATGPRLGPEPRTSPRALPPAAPQPPVAVPAPIPDGPVTSPLLTPPPTQKVPTLPPLGGDPTRAGRGRPAPQAPADAPQPPATDFPVDLEPFAPPAVALRESIDGPQVTNLPLDQAEEIKRVLQSEARYDRLRLTGLDEAKQEIAGEYRKRIEDVIAQAGDAAPPGSEVAELASEFLPVKQQLARTIAARDAAERGTAAAAKRRGISLTDYLSAGAAAGGGPAVQLLAAAGNNFARNRGTSAWASGAYGASTSVGNLVNPQLAEYLGNMGGAVAARHVRVGEGGQQPPSVGSSAQDIQRILSQNPGAFGPYSTRLQEAAARGPEAFATQDWLLGQSDPAYMQLRREALMRANGESP